MRPTRVNPEIQTLRICNTWSEVSRNHVDTAICCFLADGALPLRHTDFPNTDAVHLEENYRSSGAILAASLAVVSQGEIFQEFLAFCSDSD